MVAKKDKRQKEKTKRNKQKKTNPETGAEFQWIVAQRLLSHLHDLVAIKSSANDLSLPIFEITIDPQEPFTAVESSYVIRKTYLYPCILEAVRNIAYPAWIPA